MHKKAGDLTALLKDEERRSDRTVGKAGELLEEAFEDDSGPSGDLIDKSADKKKPKYTLPTGPGRPIPVEDLADALGWGTEQFLIYAVGIDGLKVQRKGEEITHVYQGAVARDLDKKGEYEQAEAILDL